MFRRENIMSALRGCLVALALLSCLASASAEPRWLTLPPTPTLPKAAESGLAPVNGVKLWYATFGLANRW
jgi:hypothetical protein